MLRELIISLAAWKEQILPVSNSKIAVPKYSQTSAIHDIDTKIRKIASTIMKGLPAIFSAIQPAGAGVEEFKQLIIKQMSKFIQQAKAEAIKNARLLFTQRSDHKKNNFKGSKQIEAAVAQPFMNISTEISVSSRELTSSSTPATTSSLPSEAQT